MDGLLLRVILSFPFRTNTKLKLDNTESCTTLSPATHSVESTVSAHYAFAYALRVPRHVIIYQSDILHSHCRWCVAAARGG